LGIQGIFDKSLNPDVQILAMSVLVVLMAKYAFEYESFYEKLYKMLWDKGVIGSRFSNKFFKLLELAMKNSKLPLETLAAFTKVLNGFYLIFRGRK
jgi:CBF/Mak21 family